MQTSQIASRRAPLFLWFALLAWHTSVSESFTNIGHSYSDARTYSRLFQTYNSNNYLQNDEGAYDEEFNVEDVRQRLEQLLGTPFSSDLQQESKKASTNALLLEKPPKNMDLQVSLPAPPPLTSIERKRRLAEIELIVNLQDGDECLEELQSLWCHERGFHAAMELMRAEELILDTKYDQAETLLTDLIDTHGVYWTEPAIRLADLYSTLGKLEQAKALLQIVLQVKPWHVRALSAIVRVYADMSDAQSARIWAARRLPTFAPSGTNRRRTEWTHKAVADAKRELAQAEARNLLAFGEPDNDVPLSSSQEDIDDVSWQ
jgi:hypothetical protein